MTTSKIASLMQTAVALPVASTVDLDIHKLKKTPYIVHANRSTSRAEFLWLEAKHCDWLSTHNGLNARVARSPESAVHVLRFFMARLEQVLGIELGK